MKKTINIAVMRRLVKSPLIPVVTEKIHAVSSRIRIDDVTDLILAEQQGDGTKKGQLDALLADAEIFYGFPPPKDLIARASRLKWIQTPIAGVEPFLTPDVLASSVVLTNSHGIHYTQMAELALAHMLMLAKRAPEVFAAKGRHAWLRDLVPGLLSGKTVGILGYGSIGQEIGRLAKAFNMRIIALRARVNEPAKHADLVVSPDELKKVLAESDYVVNVLPLTPRTGKLIGEKELRSMKPTAYLVNVGRGATIDEEALIRALKENWIAGAGLDVYTQRPLSSESGLWDLPNVVMTPHCGGQREDYDHLAVDLFCKNLRRYLRGKELINVVDKKRGY